MSIIECNDRKTALRIHAAVQQGAAVTQMPGGVIHIEYPSSR